MSRILMLMVVLACATFVSGCGRKPLPVSKMGINCLGMADDLKTLRVGDELPRVIQVIGIPNKSYRAFSPFGRSYDVLEYDVGGTPCARAILHSDQKLQVVFDSKGRYVGSGGEEFMKFRRATTVRVEPLVIDSVILNP